MGNIVGERFEDYVLRQIKSRQKLYGQSYGKDQKLRTPQQLQLINNKNAWLKMASATGVERDLTPAVFNQEQGKYVDTNISPGEQRLRNIGIENTENFVGNQLAKQTVLFNTLSTVNPSTEFDPKTGVGQDGMYNFRAGVSKQNTLWNSVSSYGLGGTDQGLVPAPGLIDFNVDSQNRGSIKKGTITLKCYNKFQFELIELLYLRLVYTMMIEWGWDKYKANDNTFKKVGNTLIEKEWFKDSSLTQLGMMKLIEEERSRYDGNYDGFFGKVSNFSWDFAPNGTYNINLKLISVGDVIESLKVNTVAQQLTISNIKQEIKGAYGEDNITKEKWYTGKAEEQQTGGSFNINLEDLVDGNNSSIISRRQGGNCYKHQK